MTRGYVPTLLLLALAWGSSFMFIEFAIEDLSPAATMAGRLVVAASVNSAVHSAFNRHVPWQGR